MNLMNLNRAFAFFALLIAANCHSAIAKDGQARLVKKTPKVTKSPNASPTVHCDVTNFVELEDAIIDGDGDIKLCSGKIKFEQQLDLSEKQLTFTCPNGGCVLDAESKNRFFYIRGVTSNISFDGITFKNGKISGNGYAGVSTQ